MSIQIRQEVTIIQRAGSDLVCSCDGGGASFALEVVQALPAAAVLIVAVVWRLSVGVLGGGLRIGGAALALTSGALGMLAPAFDTAGREAIRLALGKGD
jgi:hypothetical protein